MNQFQAWSRSTVHVDHKGSYLLRFSSVADVLVDGVRLAGDYYSYGTASHAIQFSEGAHEISTRLVYEIRLFGGSIPPKVNFEFEMKKIAEAARALVVEKSDVLVPDVMEGVVVSEWGAVAVINVASLGDAGEMGNWLQVVLVEAEFFTFGSNDFDNNVCSLALLLLLLRDNFACDKYFAAKVTLTCDRFYSRQRLRHLL